jgi:cytoskeletal protein RodZ
MMMAGGILLLVIVGSILALSGLQEQEKAPVVSERQAAQPPPPRAETAPAPAVPEVQPEKTPVASPAAPAAESPPPASPPAEVVEAAPAEPLGGAQALPPLPGKQILEITAVAETWMQIVIDDEKTKEVTLKPGDQLALEASRGYQLLIGNAAGVRMRLNGAPIEVKGRSGQVRSLALP